MISKKTGKCANPNCNYEGKLYAKGLCYNCYWYQNKKKNQKKKIEKYAEIPEHYRSSDNEFELFLKVWYTREQKCFVTGQPLTFQVNTDIWRSCMAPWYSISTSLSNIARIMLWKAFFRLSGLFLNTLSDRFCM